MRNVGRRPSNTRDYSLRSEELSASDHPRLPVIFQENGHFLTNNPRFESSAVVHQPSQLRSGEALFSRVANASSQSTFMHALSHKAYLISSPLSIQRCGHEHDAFLNCVIIDRMIRLPSWVLAKFKWTTSLSPKGKIHFTVAPCVCRETSKDRGKKNKRAHRLNLHAFISKKETK